MEKLHSAEEVAQILSLNIATIYSYIKQKKLKATRVGMRQYRIKDSDLSAFIEQAKS